MIFPMRRRRIILFFVVVIYGTKSCRNLDGVGGSRASLPRFFTFKNTGKTILSCHTIPKFISKLYFQVLMTV